MSWALRGWERGETPLPPCLTQRKDISTYMWGFERPQGPAAGEARSSSATATFHCPMVIMAQQAEASGAANQRLCKNLIQILPMSKVPEKGV